MQGFSYTQLNTLMLCSWYENGACLCGQWGLSVIPIAEFSSRFVCIDKM